MDRKGGKVKGSGAAAGEALLVAGIERERALIHEMESRYPERMNKGGVLSDYINRGSGSVYTGAEATAAEEAAMAELAQRFEPFDFDLISSRAQAVALKQASDAPAGSGAAPTPGTAEAEISKPISSL